MFHSLKWHSVALGRNLCRITLQGLLECHIMLCRVHRQTPKDNIFRQGLFTVYYVVQSAPANAKSKHKQGLSHRQRCFSISLFNVYIWHLAKNKINDEFFIIIDSFRCKEIPYKESSEMSIMPALPYQSHALSRLLDNDFRIEGPFFCHIYLDKYVKYICAESLNDFELRRCCFRK